MPKRRPVGSTHDALARAVGILTYAGACAATGLSENHLRKCTDPACGRDISLRAAIKIDQALVAQDDEPVMVETFGASNATDFSALSHLRRAQCEIEQASRLLERGGRDPASCAAVGRPLAELARATAALMLMNCDRQDES